MIEETTHDLEILQKRARDFLENHFTPPRRYGTAFHLNPPISDLRSFEGEILPSSQNTIHDGWRIISKEIKADIFKASFLRPSLSWQLIHLDRIPNKLVFMRDNEAASLYLREKGLYWIILGHHASLTIHDRIIGSKPGFHSVYSWQKDDSSLSITCLRGENTYLSEYIEGQLLGPRSSISITHLTYGKNNEQADIETVVYHKAPRTSSTIALRSGGVDRSTTIYRGRLDVANNAVGAKGFQSCRALHLSRTAVIDVLPRLDIRTNDVQCSHAVTATHLDDSTLFYLRSRGIPHEHARTIATLGFFNQQLSLSPSIQRTLQRMISSTP